MVVRQEQLSIHAGPLPPPEVLAQYNMVIPGLADRLFADYEEQSSHRRALETKVVDSDIQRSKLGLGSGLIVALAALGVALELGLNGQGAAAAIIGSLDLIGLVSVFVIGNTQRKSERLERVKTLAGRE